MGLITLNCMIPLRFARFAVAAAAACALSGCTLIDDSPPNASDVLAGTGGNVATERGPIGVVNASPKTTRPASPARLAVTGLKTELHDGFDRVIIPLRGDGQPGWFVDYVSSPVHASTGQPVELEGSAFLNVYIDGTVFPADVGLDSPVPSRTFGPAASSVSGPSRTGVVAEVVNTGTAAGRTHVVIGLRAISPYSVTTVHDPTRIIIDIKHT